MAKVYRGGKTYTGSTAKNIYNEIFGDVTQAKVAREGFRGQGTKAAPEGMKGLLGLLGKGKVGQAFKSHPGAMGLGGALLLGLILNKISGFAGQVSQENLQREAIGQQMGADPDDMYYQAMLPELTQERQGAQTALLQAILGGRGQQIQVPGERRI
jgi:hypothetical protein